MPISEVMKHNSEREMGKIISQCPSCHNSKLRVVKIECDGCNTTFEGKFEIPDLLKLAQDDIDFIFDFVKCSGSLKDMAIKQKVSYPTLRNRLNFLIEQIEGLEVKKTNSKVEVLQKLEEGKISVQDAASLLQNLEGKV